MHIKSWVLPFALTLTAFSCKAPKNQLLSNNVYSGRVLNAICGNVTIQTLGGGPLGENGWSNPSDTAHIHYDNVFRLGNPCDAGLIANTNDTFRFQVVANTVQDCMQCMATGNTPTTTCSIRILP